MTKEDYVKKLITNSGHTIKSFALSVNVPYTTLLSMLNRGLGGASVENVIRICKGLSITVEDLLYVENKKGEPNLFYITDHEKKLLSNYRNKPDLQHAVNILLGVDEQV